MGEVIRFPVEGARKAGRRDADCTAPRPREAMRRVLVSSHSHPREAESIWKDLGRFAGDNWAGDDWAEDDWSEDKPD
jgi:hypothetical protein